MMTTNAIRYHDICCGHRVVGHEGKCKNLHGHNYRFHFTVSLKPNNALDDVGRVLDFSVIKDTLCQWLEENWDHKMLLWTDDPLMPMLHDLDPTVVAVQFNPTAENIAQHFINLVAPFLLKDTDCYLSKLVIEETRKCSVEVSK